VADLLHTARAIGVFDADQEFVIYSRAWLESRQYLDGSRANRVSIPHGVFDPLSRRRFLLCNRRQNTPALVALIAYLRATHSPGLGEMVSLPRRAWRPGARRWRTSTSKNFSNGNFYAMLTHQPRPR
jgi:hypothetical protein